MTRSIDAAWGEDDVIFLPNYGQYYIDILHNNMKKRVYYEESKTAGPLFLDVLEAIKSILLDGTIVHNVGPEDIITFTIVSGEYHSIDDNPSFLWTRPGEKTIAKWHNYGTIIKLENTLIGPRVL